MSDHAVLREAEFDPKVETYWLVSTSVPFVAMVFGIPLLPFVWIFGRMLIGKYLERLSCTLTEGTLEIHKGILNRVQSTIPLEKITDLQMFQGPIMRHFGLHGFKVETAGQTTTGGALMSIVGIVDAPAFRQSVLAQRDAMAHGTASAPSGDGAGAVPAPARSGAEHEVLVEIRNSLLRIERHLDSADETD